MDTPTPEAVLELARETQRDIQNFIGSLSDNHRAIMGRDRRLRQRFQRALVGTDFDEATLEEIMDLRQNIQGRMLQYSGNPAELRRLQTHMESTNEILRRMRSNLANYRRTIHQMSDQLTNYLPEYDKQELFFALFREVQEWLRSHYPKGNAPAWMKRRWNDFVKLYSLGQPYKIFKNRKMLHVALYQLEHMRNDFMELPRYKSSPDSPPPEYKRKSSSSPRKNTKKQKTNGSRPIVIGAGGSEKHGSEKHGSEKHGSDKNRKKTSSPLVFTDAYNVAPAEQHIYGLQPAWMEMRKN